MDPQGIDASIKSEEARDGYVQFRPVVGDMLSLSKPVPQVQVSVNGIPSVCNGSCDFTWSPSVTPKVDSLSPVSGQLTILTLVAVCCISSFSQLSSLV